MDAYEGFHEFVLARGPALSRTAYLLTGDHQLAEDLLQQALMRTAGHWRRVSRGGNPEGYVRRAMINERTSLWRRRRYNVVALPEESLGVPDESESVLRRVTLLRALAALPPRQRVVLTLRFLHDLTEAQIAAELDCSIGTVKSHTHHGLARLRQLAPKMLAEGAPR
jgi:RNA polymerase sigma-70 factor (sigma-E family)